MKALTFTLKHLLILTVGIVLAVIFAWIVYDATNLSASVLSLSERASIEKAHWDAAYKKGAESLEVFITPQLQHYDQLFIALFFSPSEIELLPAQISSPYSWEVVSQTASSLLLKVSDFSAGNLDEGIVIVPFSGEAREITVEFVSDKAQGGELFAVGILELPL